LKLKQKFSDYQVQEETTLVQAVLFFHANLCCGYWLLVVNVTEFVIVSHYAVKHMLSKQTVQNVFALLFKFFVSF